MAGFVVMVVVVVDNLWWWWLGGWVGLWWWWRGVGGVGEILLRRSADSNTNCFI